MIKELLVSVEITNRAIKAMACEYYNTRYNVLAIDSISVSGIENYEIVDKDKVKESLKTLISNMEKKLNNAPITKVILVIPPVNFQRKSFKSEIITEQGYIKNSDVDRCISNILNTEIDNSLFIANVYITKYEVNGISSRIIPIETACQNFKINSELLITDKKLVIDYVNLFAELNIDILDVCLSTYGLAKEAVLLEESMQKNILIYEINEDNSIISYLKNNKIISIEILDKGLEYLVKPLADKYELDTKDAIRFFKYCLCKEDAYFDDAIYSWNKNEMNYSLNKRNLFDSCSTKINEFIDSLKEFIQPILDNGETKMYVVGEGADAQGLIDMIKSAINIDVEAYYPNIPGARNSIYSNIYGSFVAHKELFDLRNKKGTCVDLEKFNEGLSRKSNDFKDEEDTITTKIKKYFIGK